MSFMIVNRFSAEVEKAANISTAWEHKTMLQLPRKSILSLDPQRKEEEKEARDIRISQTS